MGRFCYGGIIPKERAFFRSKEQKKGSIRTYFIGLAYAATAPSSTRRLPDKSARW